MSEILHADIFFFITGIAVIVCSAILCVALYHAIHVLKSMRRVMRRVEEGTESIVEDVQSIREYFTQGSFLGQLFSVVTGLFKRTGTRTTRSKPGKKSDELHIKDEA